MISDRLVATVRVRTRVINAVMLRDMRTRFGRSHWGYLIAIAWPLLHLSVLVGGFVMVSRVLPLGNDSTVYIASGALPYVLCLYPARMSAIVFMQGRQVLQFPIVTTFDLIVARVVLEALNAFVVAIVFSGALWLLDAGFAPQDISAALLAIYASVFFGICLGVFGTVLAALAGTAGYMFFVLFLIGLYLSSGVTIPLAAIGANETLRTLVGFNPVYHLVLWLRSAFYQEMHQTIDLDQQYVLFISAALLFLGLLGERAFRGRIVH